MLNCTSAVSGLASNLPSAPTKTVLGCAVTAGCSCADKRQLTNSAVVRYASAAFMGLLLRSSQLITPGHCQTTTRKRKGTEINSLSNSCGNRAGAVNPNSTQCQGTCNGWSSRNS